VQIHVELTQERIVRPECCAANGTVGAWVEFAGIVRVEEEGRRIAALEYEAYDSMAARVMRELLEKLGAQHGCASVRVVHRVGVIPAGEIAIWIGVGSAHRKEALALVTDFMDCLKEDVPIWKRRALNSAEMEALST